MTLKEKLVEIYSCIESSCNSSVKIFDLKKGHSRRSVGMVAYEERQEKLLQKSKDIPQIIEFQFKRSGHNYFKFEGRTIKIISSRREPLGKNVFEKNMLEKQEDEFEYFDPLLRIIYSVDYDLSEHEAEISGCHYLEIDRSTGDVINEIDMRLLAKDKGRNLTEVLNETPKGVELPSGHLLKKLQNKTAKKPK